MARKNDRDDGLHDIVPWHRNLPGHTVIGLQLVSWTSYTLGNGSVDV